MASWTAYSASRASMSPTLSYLCLRRRRRPRRRRRQGILERDKRRVIYSTLKSTCLAPSIQSTLDFPTCHGTPASLSSRALQASTRPPYNHSTLPRNTVSLDSRDPWRLYSHTRSASSCWRQARTCHRTIKPRRNKITTTHHYR